MRRYENRSTLEEWGKLLIITGLFLGQLTHWYATVFLTATVMTLGAFAGLTVYAHVKTLRLRRQHRNRSGLKRSTPFPFPIGRGPLK